MQREPITNSGDDRLHKMLGASRTLQTVSSRAHGAFNANLTIVDVSALEKRVRQSLRVEFAAFYSGNSSRAGSGNQKLAVTPIA